MCTGNCTDVNECDSPQACLYGTCINTQGSFICQCPPNYQLVPAGNACVGELTHSFPADMFNVIDFLPYGAKFKICQFESRNVFSLKL